MADLRIARDQGRRWLRSTGLLLTLVLAVACGNDTATSPTTPVTSQQSVREWTTPALPMVERIEQLILDAGRAARSGNVPAFQAATIQLTEALAGVQSAVAGPLPASALAEGEAWIRSTADYESASRSASSCDSVSACLDELESINVAGDKWADAFGALADRA